MTALGKKATLRDQIRDGLRCIAAQATQARRLSVTSDNMCDRLDDIDNEVQRVVELVNRARRQDGNA